MIVLFKKRKFSDYFSDTIDFFKTTGKHYFKNYFIIIGGFLIALVVLIYFIATTYLEVLFASFNNQTANANFTLDYLSENFVLYAAVLVVFVLLAIILSIINITYPVLYLQLIEKNNRVDFSTKAIISAMKANIGRMLVFFLGMLFVIFPLALVIFGLTFLLVFIVIGVPLLFIIVPAFLSWIALSYHEYIIKRVGFFTALNSGFEMLKQQFWTIVGTTILMLFAVQMLQGIVTLIPYIIGFVSLFSSISDDVSDPNAIQTGASILFVIIMTLSVLISYIFNNFMIINQGLMYYSLREENENNSINTEIDAIGTDFE